MGEVISEPRPVATLVLPMRADALDEQALCQAAARIHAGQLVAFPTETVYGLGANALDADAVARIFVAKGRPATNPVIVHVSSIAEIETLIASQPPHLRTLATVFWPGPLTLVLPKSDNVPSIVTAGGPTIAIRVPAHPVAQALLRACQKPLAAPSANRSTCLSPTRAEHVLRGLDGRIDLLIDSGSCQGGLESTVLDLTTQPPTLLRPGLVTQAQIETLIGPIQRRTASAHHDDIARSPGQMKRHYAPTTAIEFVADSGLVRVLDLASEGLRVGWLAFGPVNESHPANVKKVAMPTEPSAYASCLYDALHALDDAGLDRLILALPPEDDEWLAIHDRLGRMS